MIRLQVVGIPAPQGSKSGFVRGGHVVIVEGTGPKGRAGHTAWRQAVATAGRDWLAEHPQSPLAEPVKVDMHFRFAVVASHRYRYWHQTAPDLDKLVRSVGDSLTSCGLLADDRYISQIHAGKTYCRPGEPAGCEILISSLAADEAQISALRKKDAAQARKEARAS